MSGGGQAKSSRQRTAYREIFVFEYLDDGSVADLKNRSQKKTPIEVRAETDVRCVGVMPVLPLDITSHRCA
jgi:hypothetical protein